MAKPHLAKNHGKRTLSSAGSLSIEGYYNCSREEAKELFQPFILLDGMYLVRPSEAQSSNILYTLSVTKQRKVYNYRIQQDPKTKQYFVQEVNKFADVPKLIKAYKEKPINPQLNVILVAPLVQGKKRKQNSQAFLANFSKGQQDLEELPGMHQYLPRSEIKHVMAGYMNRPGTFLLRPSLTSEGSLTLTVVHKYELLHFKITQDLITREVCVAAKKFTNFSELLDFYKHNPLKIKSRPNENVLLTFPLPVDKSLENVHKLAQEELYAELSGIQPLPPDWTEHYDDNHKRNYYYNNKTRETSWTKPLSGPPPPPARSPVSPTRSVGAPALPPARKSVSHSVSAPVVAPPRSRASLAEIPKSQLPSGTGDTGDTDAEYIAVGEIPASPKVKQPQFEEEDDEYLLVGSLSPVPEDDVLSDNAKQLSRTTSAPVTGKAPDHGIKRMSLIKANKETMKEEKEKLKKQKLDERTKVKQEKGEKKEAARKAKEEAKRLKAEETQKKKEEAKRLKEEAKRQKEEEKKRIREEKQRKKSGAQSPNPESLTLESAPSSSQTMPASMKPGPPFPPPRVDLGDQPSASSVTGPPSLPPHVDLEENRQRASTLSGAPPPPPRVDLLPEEDKPKTLTMGGPPAPPPRVDLEPQTNSGPPTLPTHVDVEPQTTASGPPPVPPPPPLTETALEAAANTKSSQQVEKERKAAEKKRRQRLKRVAAKREKEEAKRQKEEQKKERKMSKSLSKASTSDVPTTDVPVVVVPPSPPAGNVPAPPPPPPIGGNGTSASNVPSSTPSKPIVPPIATPPVASMTSSAPLPPPLAPIMPPAAPQPPPITPMTPPSAPAAPPPLPVSHTSPTVPAAPPLPPLSPPPPPVSSPTSPTSPSSISSRGFSAEDLMAGRNKLTTAAAAPVEKAPQKAAGLGGIMQSAFDQFNDKIGAMRSFVEYSDDEDFEDIEEDEDWD